MVNLLGMDITEGAENGQPAGAAFIVRPLSRLQSSMNIRKNTLKQNRKPVCRRCLICSNPRSGSAG